MARVPGAVSRQAPCSAQTPGRSASVTARAGTPAPNRGSQNYRPGSRYRIATGSTLSALSRPSGTYNRTTQNACPSPPQAVRRRKRPPARLRSCIAAVVYLYSCVGVLRRANLVCGRRRVGRPAVRPCQRVRSAAPLASPPQARPTPLRCAPPTAVGLPRRFWIQSGNDQKTRNAPQPAAKRPGATDPAPTSPPAELFHLLHPRQHTTTRCRHTTAPARPRTNAGRDAQAKPRSTQQNFVKGDLADVGHLATKRDSSLTRPDSCNTNRFDVNR